MLSLIGQTPGHPAPTGERSDRYFTSSVPVIVGWTVQAKV
jgi:hypothetical protein